MIEVFDGGTKIAEEVFPDAYVKEGGNPDDPRDYILPIHCEMMMNGDPRPMTKWWYYDRQRKCWQAHEHIL